MSKWHSAVRVSLACRVLDKDSIKRRRATLHAAACDGKPIDPESSQVAIASRLPRLPPVGWSVTRVPAVREQAI